MKSQRGITLISLTVYIIVMVIVVATLTIISNFFFKNMKLSSKNIDPLTEYTKFTTFFTDEINHNNIKVLDCKTDSTTENSYVVFDDGVQYTFVKENKGIYRNKIKICRDVENCTFDYEIKNGKDVVTTDITMDGIEKRTVEYTIKN